MTALDNQEIKVMIDDLTMVQEDLWNCLDAEPVKNDRLNGSIYMIARIIRVLKNQIGYDNWSFGSDGEYK